MSSYIDLISRKLAYIAPVGLLSLPALAAGLFDHQGALTGWALRRGRCAIFADTGLGKTRMELAWALALMQALGIDILILAPLAVASQTVAEGKAMGIEVHLCRSDADVRRGINITNYDRLHKFDTSRFGAVVLDESSCIKHHDSKTLQLLMDAFASTPYKLCATATPAPNDWTELGTHAEFLGICKRTEMLSEFFVHDGGDTQTWRLKGHAQQAFWRWVSSWGAMVRSPADLGFDGSAYELPQLNIFEHLVEARQHDTGLLFPMPAQTLSERREARKRSMDLRVQACADLVNSQPDEAWLVWCDLNAEQDLLRKSIHASAFSVQGSDDIDAKEESITGWLRGERPVMISKPSIMGWGINAQRCASMAFVGVTDSYEAYYQAVRRCWRFGQKRPVHVHVFASEAEGAVVANLRRKERDAQAMAESLSAETREAVMQEVIGSARYTNNYHAHTKIKRPSWLQSESV